MGLKLYSYFLLILITMTYVKGERECPTKVVKWQQRAEIICKDFKKDYHCVPTAELNSFKEFCQKPIKIPKGYCAVYNDYVQKLSWDRYTRCFGKNITGCPKESYLSNNTIFYPACLRINAEKGCYLAYSNCPDITRLNISQTSDVTTSPSSPHGTTHTSPKSRTGHLRPTIWMIIISVLFLKLLLL